MSISFFKIKYLNSISIKAPLRFVSDKYFLTVLISLALNCGHAHADANWDGPSDAEYSMCIKAETFPDGTKDGFISGSISAMKIFNETNPLKKNFFRWAIQYGDDSPTACTGDSDGDISMIYPGSAYYAIKSGAAAAFATPFGNIFILSDGGQWVNSDASMPRKHGHEYSEVLLHELGHVAGMSHVKNVPSFMAWGDFISENSNHWTTFIDGEAGKELASDWSDITPASFVDVGLLKQKIVGIQSASLISGGDLGDISRTSVALTESGLEFPLFFGSHLTEIAPSGYFYGDLSLETAFGTYPTLIYPVFTVSLTAGAEIQKNNPIPIEAEFRSIPGNQLLGKKQVGTIYGGTGVITTRLPIELPTQGAPYEKLRLILRVKPESLGLQDSSNNNEIEYFLTFIGSSAYAKPTVFTGDDHLITTVTTSAGNPNWSKLPAGTELTNLNNFREWDCDGNLVPYALVFKSPMSPLPGTEQLTEPAKEFLSKTNSCHYKFTVSSPSSTPISCTTPAEKFQPSKQHSCSAKIPSNFGEDIKIGYEFICPHENSSLKLNQYSNIYYKIKPHYGAENGSIAYPEDFKLTVPTDGMLDLKWVNNLNLTSSPSGVLKHPLWIEAKAGGYKISSCTNNLGATEPISKLTPCDMSFQITQIENETGNSVKNTILNLVQKNITPGKLVAWGQETLLPGKYSISAQTLCGNKTSISTLQTIINVTPEACDKNEANFGAPWITTPSLFFESGIHFAGAKGYDSTCGALSYEFELKHSSIPYDGQGLIQTATFPNSSISNIDAVNGYINFYDALEKFKLWNKPIKMRVRAINSKGIPSEWVEFATLPVTPSPDPNEPKFPYY